MKTNLTRNFFVALLVSCFSLAATHSLFAQGRVILNEFLPWPGNACGTTAEFVEILNMGPGPMNIGCYILTDGDFSITIPAGTILQPGQFYVISGQDFLPMPCGNINANVTVDLNWTTCGCTSGVIPTTGDGLFTDGGSANEQVVLLNPSGAIVDAVIRDFPAEASSSITSSSAGGCSPVTFDLDNMGVQYETIGESAGRANSFARKTDGACGWLKDTQQSGGATNNTPGEDPDLDISMAIIEEPNCGGGTAIFTVNNSPPNSYFPIDYILGYDSNGDGQFTSADTYSTGVDNTPPSLTIAGLVPGLYRINIGSAEGCDFRDFSFMVGPCSPLAVKLISFNAVQEREKIKLTWGIQNTNVLNEIRIEASMDGNRFTTLGSETVKHFNTTEFFSYTVNNLQWKYFRLQLINKQAVINFSNVIRPGTGGLFDKPLKISPNPVYDQFNLEYFSLSGSRISVIILTAGGQTAKKLQLRAEEGYNRFIVNLSGLKKGIYFVQVTDPLHEKKHFSKLLKQ
ncbi:MAG: lamin tail domain-containing protein [Chitinophagaceae bacterium]|nr:lamin tail domain-containing protein [Chitinophagaceae bacterium]